jgi:hypothetical protein
MYFLIKNLSIEAVPELTDKKNNAINELTKTIYTYDDCTIIFNNPKNDFQLGVVEFTDKTNFTCRGIFNIYIHKDEIYAALLTLDMVKLIDVPFMDFLTEVVNYSQFNLSA